MIPHRVPIESELYLAAPLLRAERGVPERVQDFEQRMSGGMEFDIPRHEVVTESEGLHRSRFLDKPFHEDASVDHEVRTVDPSIPG